jgi:hypothetical protein
LVLALVMSISLLASLLDEETVESSCVYTNDMSSFLSGFP